MNNFKAINKSENQSLGSDNINSASTTYKQSSTLALNPKIPIQFQLNPDNILALQRTIGNRAVVQLLSELKNSTEQAQNVHKIAAKGVEGTGNKLPHFDKIQQAFGSHDVSNVQAYTDRSAAVANQAIGAKAYATGNKVAFSEANPSLHTAAHEAAHTIQQSSGVQLKDGIGQEGDSFEQHADLVADQVVQGKSAENLLNQVTHQPKTDAAITAPVQKETLLQKNGLGQALSTAAIIGGVTLAAAVGGPAAFLGAGALGLAGVGGLLYNLLPEENQANNSQESQPSNLLSSNPHSNPLSSSPQSNLLASSAPSDLLSSAPPKKKKKKKKKKKAASTNTGMPSTLASSVVSIGLQDEESSEEESSAEENDIEAYESKDVKATESEDEWITPSARTRSSATERQQRARARNQAMAIIAKKAIAQIKPEETDTTLCVFLDAMGNVVATGESGWKHRKKRYDKQVIAKAIPNEFLISEDNKGQASGYGGVVCAEPQAMIEAFISNSHANYSLAYDQKSKKCKPACGSCAKNLKEKSIVDLIPYV